MASTGTRTLFLAALLGRPVAEAYPEVGCFTDGGATGSGQKGRQMQHQVCEMTGPICEQLVPSKCAVACKNGGYALYGVEAGHQCYCDNAVADPTKKLTSPADCAEPCNGNTLCALSETCGGIDQLFVGDVNGDLPNCNASSQVQPAESRNIYNGTIMFSYGYLDQPYCQVNPKTNEWTCITTASPQHEGGAGEHMISQVSADEGQSWTKPVFIEKDMSVDNSYGTLAIADSGRLYAMYNMNLDNVTHFPAGGALGRTDELGHFVYKYSDDAGRTWSDTRYEIPYRVTPVDVANNWKGAVKLMWCVDQVKKVDGTDESSGSVVYGFTKIGTYVQNAPQELWFLASDNLLTEADGSKVVWKLLPEGEHGILPPGVAQGPPADPAGDVLEEAHIVPLASGGFYAVGRTTQGFLAATHTAATIESGLGGWAATGYAAYFNVTESPRGRFVPITTAQPVRKVGAAGYGLKNPRGPITPKRMANGMYLLLYYNNAGNSFGQRNPYWLACGIEAPGSGILWSQPEIVIYDRYNHGNRPGYPDFIQSPKTGAIYITETQKDTTRLHRIGDGLLAALFGQHNGSTIAPSAAATLCKGGCTTASPKFGRINDWTHAGQGFTATLLLASGATASAGAVLLDARAPGGTAGVAVIVGTNGSVELHLQDTKSAAPGLRGIYQTDPLCSKVLASPGDHFVGVVVDAGPMVATFIVDGLVCDGGHAGSKWANGWFWVPAIGSLDAGAQMAVGDVVTGGHFYERALYNSEVIGNYRAYLADPDGLADHT